MQWKISNWYLQIEKKPTNNSKYFNDGNILATQYAILKCPVKSNPKQPSCKRKCTAPKGHCEKSFEIQSGGQEMALMFGLWQKF